MQVVEVGAGPEHVSWEFQRSWGQASGPAAVPLGPRMHFGHSLFDASPVLLAQGPAGLETSSGSSHLKGLGLKVGEGGNVDGLGRGG